MRTEILAVASLAALALLLMGAGTNFDSVPASDAGSTYRFRESGVTKATIEKGGLYCPGAFVTSALPALCKDGSMAWDSTLHAMKVCSGNTWSAPGAAASFWVEGSDGGIGYTGSVGVSAAVVSYTLVSTNLYTGSAQIAGPISGGSDAAVQIEAPGLATGRIIAGELCLGDGGCKAKLASTPPLCGASSVLTNSDAGYRCVDSIYSASSATVADHLGGTCTNCSAGHVALGIDAYGAAVCTDTVHKADLLTTTPSQCSAGQAPRGINTSGDSQNCTEFNPTIGMNGTRAVMTPAGCCTMTFANGVLTSTTCSTTGC